MIHVVPHKIKLFQLDKHLKIREIQKHLLFETCTKYPHKHIHTTQHYSITPNQHREMSLPMSISDATRIITALRTVLGEHHTANTLSTLPISDAQLAQIRTALDQPDTSLMSVMTSILTAIRTLSVSSHPIERLQKVATTRLSTLAFSTLSKLTKTSIFPHL